LTDDEMLN